MARTETVVLVCDAYHAAETAGVLTRTLTLGDRTYEIDLCEDHDAEFGQALARILQYARESAGPRRHKPRSMAKRQLDAAVRAWWRNHSGPSLPPYTDRGRIPVSVHNAYTARSS